MLQLSRRARSATVVLTLTAGLVAPAIAAGAANASLPPGSATKAASFGLARHLGLQGNKLTTTFSGTSYPDYGSTVDSVLALDAAHTGQTQARRSALYIARNIGAYVGTGTERYAGATAKALLMGQAQRMLVNGKLGGLNLKASLISREQANGRFTDKSQYGDYSNTFSQGLALVALRRVGVRPDARAVRYLFNQQCPNGGFRLDEADAACTTDADATAIDSTSVAVQGLLAVPQGTEAKQRMADAMTFLKSHQQSDGGFAGGDFEENSNTAGLGAIALVAGGQSAAAAKAKAFLGKLTYSCSAPVGLRGLVAYSASTYAGKQRTVEQELKATSQALQGLAGVPYMSVTRAHARASAANPC